MKNSRRDYTLKEHTVHLWLARLSCSHDQLSIMSAEESTRASRFIKPADQEKYRASRVILRTILSKYLSIPPADILFETNAHGKPYLSNTALQFNLSHSGDYLLVGVTLGNHIGVDIECEKKAIDFLALAQRFFAPAEYQAMISLPEPEQKAAFYRCWTRKEAFMKATGLGLSFGLANFVVDTAEDPAQSNALRHIENDKVKNWTLQSILLPALQHYHAAFALEGACEELAVFEADKY